MIPTIVMEVALKEGQKAAANVASKLATAIISALVARKVIDKIAEKDKPLVLYQGEDRNKATRRRIVRDSSVAASISMIGAAANMFISNGIEVSDWR